MISRRGKFGAAFVVAVLLMAVIGGWLGNQDQQQMAVAHAPAHKVIAPPASPEIPPPVNQAMPARIVKPMGPFAPPLPDLPLSQEEKPLPVEGGRVELDTKHPSQTATVAPDAVIAHPAPETILPPPAPSGSSGRSSGLQPQAWTRNAIAAPANPGHLPMIAIVIDDLGSAPAHAAAALALPAPVTMAVLPYAHNAAQLASTARLRGHEVLVHLPMEAAGEQDPGPHALLTSLTPQEFAQRVQWNLSRFDGYVGVNNHMGSKLTQNSAAMAMLMAQLKQRGLLFLDSRTAKHTLAANTARNTGMTTLERDVFLDNVITPETIRVQLRKAEEIAHRNGYAIAIGHPHPATINALTEWAVDLEARGFRLAPLSAIARSGPSGKRVVSLPLPGG